jgi:CubicO group peptidase (beta-lactamase class C family)
MNRSHLRLLLCLTVLSALAVPTLVPGQASPDVIERVDALFGRWSGTDVPGCAVAADREGVELLARAHGMADLEHGIENTLETIFEAGSVSKQFAAGAIVLLALDGTLSLDDDVRLHIPELPDYGSPITIRHLLNHTSGLRDWGSVAALSGWGRSERTHTQADLEAFTGTYHSPDAEATFTVTVEEGQLVILRRPAARFPLVPVYVDAFRGPAGLVRFHRGDSGEVVELGLRQARVHDIRFHRVPDRIAG